MYFHVDESGNTGNNLFDPDQMRLSYGLLSSRTNVDALGQQIHGKMLRVVGRDVLHANDLGVEKLTQIAPLLIELQEKMKFDFDYYFIDKPTYGLVLLFDAIFDAGLNKAVKWDSYWTPLRFVLIHKLGSVLDEPLLREAWRLCIHKHISGEGQAIVGLLTELTGRVQASNLDSRSKEIMVDAFAFGINHPLELDFGTFDQKIVSPNAVCFQFVVSAMAMRLRKKGLKDASSIIIDRQAEFNRAQIGTHYHQKLVADGLKNASPLDRKRYIGHPLYENIGADELLRRGMPQAEIQIQRSSNSIGLQIVDIYLWITNRMLTRAELSDELAYVGSTFLRRSFVDGISLEGMANRFKEFEKKLPTLKNLSEEQKESARRDVEEHRERVKALAK
jgi:hypothetical protein